MEGCNKQIISTYKLIAYEPHSNEYDDDDDNAISNTIEVELLRCATDWYPPATTKNFSSRMPMGFRNGFYNRAFQYIIKIITM